MHNVFQPDPSSQLACKLVTNENFANLMRNVFESLRD